MPFTFGSDLILGSKMAAALFAASAALAIYFVFKRHNVRWPIFWTFMVYFGTTDFLFRISMARPQTISIIFLILLFSFLIKPLSSSAKKQVLLIFVLSAALTWIHLSFFWTALLILSVTAIVKLIISKRVILSESLVILIGLITGWLLRPNPLGAAKIVWVQLFQLFFEKQKGMQLLFGLELKPLDWQAIKFQLLPMLVIWIGAAVLALYFIFSEKNRTHTAFEKEIIWTSLFISVVFLTLAFIAGRRATDFWALFGVIFAGSVFNQFLKSQEYRKKNFKTVVSFCLWIIFVFMIVRHSQIFYVYASEDNTLAPNHLKEAALWLKDNSQNGDIVFHTSWDSFGPLFYWNQKNYYINGADPIFEYAFSKELYWKNHLLALSGKDYVCGFVPCSKNNGESLYKVLAEDFRARYIVIELSRNSGLAGHLNKDFHFEKVFDNGKEVIYRLI